MSSNTVKAFIAFTIFALLPLIIPNSYAVCAAEYLELGEPCIDEFGTLIETRTPYHQIKAGISPENIICTDERVLIFKASTDSPACVFPESVSKLIERGWAK